MMLFFIKLTKEIHSVHKWSFPKYQTKKAQAFRHIYLYSIVRMQAVSSLHNVPKIFNNYSMSPCWIWSDKITNERVARVGYNHFISNNGEWNNCFSKFSNRVLPPIVISTILQSENF